MAFEAASQMQASMVAVGDLRERWVQSQSDCVRSPSKCLYWAMQIALRLQDAG